MNRLLALLVLSLLVALSACAPQQRRLTGAKWASRSPSPPAYPAAKPTPIDPALRQAARQVIDEAARSGDAVRRANAIEARREARAVDDPAAVVNGLRDPDPIVRFAAAMAAGDLRLRQAYGELLNRVGDPDPDVRVAVRYALHRLGNTEFSQDLAKFAQDERSSVRANTALVLGRLEEPSALKILRPMQRDRTPAVRLQVAEAMWRLGDRTGLENVVAGTISQYPDDQIVSYLALAGPRDQRVGEHIRNGLTAQHTEVQLAAARAMGMIGSDEGYGIATAAAKSADPRQRALAAFAFGDIGRSDAQPLLANLLKDENADVRLAAAVALLKLREDR